MSADLELRQELVEIRLPHGEMSTSSVKASSQSSEITDDGIRTSSSTGSSSSSTGEELQQNFQTPKTGSEKGSTSKGGEGGEGGERENEQCRTPSSPGNMIPAIHSCPPAPKKQRPSAVSCKRKLVFFDQVVARDEIDSFFKQFSIDVNSKRRCLV